MLRIGTILGQQTGKLKLRLTRKGLGMLRANRGYELRATVVGTSTNRVGATTAIKRKLVLRGRSTTNPG